MLILGPKLDPKRYRAPKFTVFCPHLWEGLESIISFYSCR